MQRRRFICACGASMAGFLSKPAQAQNDYVPGAPSGGSTVINVPRTASGLAQRAGSYQGGCSLLNGASASVLDKRRIQRSSGIPVLDGMLHQEAARLRAMFEVSPDVAWFDDRGSPNAFATTDTLIGSSPYGSILLGLELSSSILRKFSQLNVMATWVAMSVLAHEFGHILQFDFLKKGSHARHESKYPELHADFLAGAYLTQRALEALRFGTDLRGPIQAAMRQFYQIGDTDFNSPGHHGTSQERMAAFNGGVTYVMQLAQSGGYASAPQFFELARSRVGY